MTGNSGAVGSVQKGKSSILILAVCLLVLMGVLFRQSFARYMVLFANDSPLGVFFGYPLEGPFDFGSFWTNLNWLGFAEPSGIIDATQVLYHALGPVLYAKFYAPICLVILGLSAWLFCRVLRFRPWVCVLVGLAAALNMNSFSAACWGLPTRSLSFAAAFLALAAVHSATRSKPWAKLILAGAAVGMGLMEAYDVGAIFSLYVAAYALFLALISDGPAVLRTAKGIGRVALVAVCAGLVAAQALSTLVGTQVKGVAGMEQTEANLQKRWDEATQWSLPKIEILRVIIPGLFGYRMDTPDGGTYWGRVGRTPGWEVHGMGTPRSSGAGEYAGILVALIAFWAVAVSLRRAGNPLSSEERKSIWFWSVMALISALLAFGRYAPFYQIVYHLPYFSTIRNPMKFMHPFDVALLILFAYGLQDLYRRYLDVAVAKAGGFGAQFKSWWKNKPAFERKWTFWVLALFAVSILGFLLYASSLPALEQYLQQNGFNERYGGDAAMRASISHFSAREVGLFLVFFGLSIAVVLTIISGAFSGRRARWATLVLGVILVVDLCRADVPWIMYYNYQTRYESNSVIDVLKDKPYEHRVTAPLYLADNRAPYFPQICNEWLQQHFQYYQIESLDVIQLPRPPVDYERYMYETFRLNPTNLFAQGRLWELTNTRYVLGMANLAQFGPTTNFLNQLFDPVQKRFQVRMAFDFAKTPEDTVTTVPKPDGPFALFEFTGALPRTLLYTNWITQANDDEMLKMLASPSFHPHDTVIVATNLPAPPTTAPAAPGKADIVSYYFRRVVVEAETAQPAVLLLNDRYDPNWHLRVDDKPATLLRCNYLMRGVYLDPGRHRVEFTFQPPMTPFYVSLAAILASLCTCLYAAVGDRAVVRAAEPVAEVKRS